ncbi:MAG: pre-16S rRNA-processing nuclease YqgF [Candidatus Eremiobacterota bacterium]
MKREKIILSIDPGREKCGVAILSSHKGVICHKVIMTDNFLDELNHIISPYNLYCIVLGDRTACSEIRKKLSSVKSEKGIVSVDEHMTTELARKRYFIENPPEGFKKFIPRGLMVPPEPYDDYAAIILGERFFKNEQ